MNDVYRLIPLCIPRELHAIIYRYAGTCTPSCKNIKLYKEQIKHDIFPLNADGLWGSLVGYGSQNYSVSHDVKMLTNPALDMKITYIHVWVKNCFTQINKWGEMYDNEKQCIQTKCGEQIAVIRKEQTHRLHQKYATLELSDSLEGYAEV